MGMFQQKVKVYNLYDQSLFSEADFWIDSGALYSFIPEDFTKKIKLEPSGTRNLVFADGRTDTRLFGTCLFEIEGFEDKVPCPVIVAPVGSLFLLGATAMENFGVQADPIHKKLIPILSIIGGFIASK